MDRNKIALSALALDLKRVALGYHRKSLKTADVFTKEALKRKNEIRLEEVKPYLKDLLNNLSVILSQKDHIRLAEDALMYSILFQNAAVSSSGGRNSSPSLLVS